MAQPITGRMALPERVRIVEVGPRDGLQNEPTAVSVDVKVALIERLVSAGLTVVEAGSFVSPKWVPQMADSGAVLARLPKGGQARFPVLVPNDKGLDQALEAGAEEIAVFGAASEAFSRKNDLVFLDFQVDQTENVYPMVQGGKGLTEMILSAEDL